MKKSLFILLLPLIMSSCTAKINDTLEKDEQILLNEPSESINRENLVFIDDLSYQKADDIYRYCYTLKLDETKCQQLNQVRVLLSLSKTNFYFFGYDSIYTLVSDSSKVNQKEKIYAGININFSTSVKVTSCIAYFKSENYTKIYNVNLSEENL